jgi:hypothetical protein
MIWKSMMAAGLAALVAAAPAQASDENVEEKSAKEKKICRTEKVTGSLARKRRTCMTQKEWDELAARTKQSLDEYTGNAGGAPKCIGLNDVACTGPQ